jgi:hypothetical protein
VEKFFPTQPYPASLSTCPENQFPAMDASYSILLHALRKMELRIGEVLDERGATRALRGTPPAGQVSSTGSRAVLRSTRNEAELIPDQAVPDQAVVLGANPAPLATAVDTPFTCSPKCLCLAIHSWKTLITMPLQEFKGIKVARVLDPICMLLNIYCLGDRGELLLILY